MNDFTKPEYRIRLFLSVDLTGSTHFKSLENQTNFIWLKAFQKFYGEFPALYSEKYDLICNNRANVCDEVEQPLRPKVWKTIGDEIIFVNRIHSVTHLGAYISAFSEALKEFGNEIHGIHGLNTKGNGWIAAFPNPNCSIQLSKEGDTAPVGGQNDIVTEEFESAADEKPNEFDFLGKGIDGGFRIARNSSIDTFTISPALAYLLCKAKKNSDMTNFECDFLFHETQSLKGVVSGRHYPIVSIDTNRDSAQREIEKLQADLLKQPTIAEWEQLMEYLEKYISYNGIEEPQLKISANSAAIDPPEHYQQYLKDWEAVAKDLDNSQALEAEAASQEGGVADDPLEEASAAVDKLVKS
jgi:hypothetical protein